jgi:hypothetical protein
LADLTSDLDGGFYNRRPDNALHDMIAAAVKRVDMQTQRTNLTIAHGLPILAVLRRYKAGKNLQRKHRANLKLSLAGHSQSVQYRHRCLACVLV